MQRSPRSSDGRGRPDTSASGSPRIFGITLDPSATATAIYGRFTSGVLHDRTVNVKWHLKRQGILDATQSDTPGLLPRDDRAVSARRSLSTERHLLMAVLIMSDTRVS
jgi:hypothetical protein